jgi:hypothetical protein
LNACEKEKVLDNKKLILVTGIKYQVSSSWTDDFNKIVKKKQH